MVALVPVLIGLGAGTTLAEGLGHGYRQAMLVIGALSAASAIVTWLFVSDEAAAADGLVAPVAQPALDQLQPGRSA